MSYACPKGQVPITINRVATRLFALARPCLINPSFGLQQVIRFVTYFLVWDNNRESIEKDDRLLPPRNRCETASCGVPRRRSQLPVIRVRTARAARRSRSAYQFATTSCAR